ncbi:hypothetical protein BpHYR1_001582 [Brachionus plicatilis]|uniref:Uncharacterized protein n=1 Tax=Brachionus plicatilis TaxID=10195 RepID=A0A3M7QJJ6_BRAPC|nr:hypothetical protein BpHYR1_001582 [Brachionus plicatilis]
MFNRSKIDGFHKSLIGSSAKLSSASKENIFDEDDVERYDADTYRQKYGDKWKKFATTVRDVVQPDGTIIREYVIEDPSLLDQLSEDDEKVMTKKEPNNKQAQKSSTNFSNNFKSSVTNLRNKYEPKTNQKINLSSSSSTSSAQTYSSSSGTSLTNSKNINLFQPIAQTSRNNFHQNNSSKANKSDESSKSNSLKSNVDDVDKEVEKIHEQVNANNDASTKMIDFLDRKKSMTFFNN